MQQNKIAVVSTISGTDEPQASTVICLVDDGFNIYFATMTGTRKFKNIERNCNVGVSVGTDPAHPVCVQLQGKAEIIKDPKDVVIDYFQKRMNLMDGFPTPEWMPLIKMKEQEFVVIKVKPYWVRFMDLENGAGEMYHQIIPG